MTELTFHPDRLFPSETGARDVARRLYAEVKDLPIISPHGHTDPQWFADNEPFGNAAELLIRPEKFGASLPRITSCFAARLHVCGWTMCSKRFLALRRP